MKKIAIALIFLFFSLNAFGINVLFIAPSGNYAIISQQMINGFELSLPQGVNVIQVNSENSYKIYLENYKPEIVIGPFFDANVVRLEKEVCNKNLYVFLPFSKDTDNCSNVFFLGYDPIRAAQEAANSVCNTEAQSIAVFYSFNKLNMAEKDEFLKGLSVCGKSALLVSGIPTFFNLMDQFVKETFGVRRLKRFSGLTQGRIFTYNLRLDTLVVFAPSDVFAHLLSVLDYYDIYPESIFSIDLTTDEHILAINRSMLKHVNIITPFYMCGVGSLSENFLKQYRERYYENPTRFSALGFDLGLLVSHILKTGSLAGFNDKKLLEGHLLFFNDRNIAVMEYKKIGYKEIVRCRRQILNR